MLSSIYNWFTEGFDTAYLKDARLCSMNWPRNQVHYAIAGIVGWTCSFQASVRERLCDSHRRASAPSRGLIAAFPTIRTSGALIESPRSSRSQGDRVIALIATTLAPSRMTVGTLLVFALTLGWNVQRAWSATPRRCVPGGACAQQFRQPE
jgi:hypothetical protein